MLEQADTTRPDRELPTFLSMVRWVSAWLVMLGHLRTLWFVPRAEVAEPSLAFDGFAWLAGFSHAGVIAFFVLSGYLVGGRVLDAHAAGRGYARYFVDRITRLHVVLIPAFVFTWLLVVVGSWITGDATVLDRPENSMFALVANLVFLQNVIAPTFAGNLPLWSLCNEFWYYLMTPLLIVAMCTWRGAARWLAFAGLGILLWWFGLELAVYWCAWLLGMLVRTRAVPKLDRRLALVLWIAVVALVRTLHAKAWLPLDMLQALALAVVIASFQGAREGLARPGGGLHDRLADWSFSLYVVHAPLMTFIAIALSGREGGLNLQPSWGTSSQFALCFVAVLAGAWLFAQITERHTETVRRWLHGRLGWTASLRAQAPS